jgi:hypothetical protein
MSANRCSGAQARWPWRRRFHLRRRWLRKAWARRDGGAGSIFVLDTDDRGGRHGTRGGHGRGGRGNTRAIGVATALTGGPHNFGLGIGGLETSTEIDPQNFWGHSQTQSAMR